MPPYVSREPHNMAEARENSESVPPTVNVLPEAFPLENSLPQLLINQSGVSEEEELVTKRSLRLRVVAREMSLQRLSVYTPALVNLDLSGSCLTSLRDLGCNLRLQSLCVRHCGLDCLDGLLGLTSLRELNAAHNSIRDVGPCAMLPRIQIIDLTSNEVCDLEQLGFLSMCAQLRILSLAGCPVESTRDYRSHVVAILPELHSLDGQPLPVDGVERNSCLIDEENEDENSDVDTESKAVDIERNSSTLKHQGASSSTEEKRTQVRPSTSTGLRPSTSKEKTYTRARPHTARPTAAVSVEEVREIGRSDGEGEETSRLTSGVIVCGNLTAALRRSKQKRQDAWLHSEPAFNSEVTQETKDERSKEIKSLLTASRNWREAFVHYRELNREKWRDEEIEDNKDSSKDSNLHES